MGPKEPSFFYANCAIRNPSKAYAESVKLDKENKSIPEKEDNTVVQYESKVEEKSWLEHCYTCMLRTGIDWEEHAEEMISECGNCLTLTYMGDNVVLIQSRMRNNIKELLEDWDEWIRYWFEWVRPWKPIDVCHKRLVWTRWVGVPLHAWSSSFFELVSRKLGSFVKLDERSRNKLRLDFARVLISVPYLDDVNQIISVKVDDRLFSVKILEEVLPNLGDKGWIPTVS